MKQFRVTVVLVLAALFCVCKSGAEELRGVLELNSSLEFDFVPTSSFLQSLLGTINLGTGNERIEDFSARLCNGRLMLGRDLSLYFHSNDDVFYRVGRLKGAHTVELYPGLRYRRAGMMAFFETCAPARNRKRYYLEIPSKYVHEGAPPEEMDMGDWLCILSCTAPPACSGTTYAAGELETLSRILTSALPSGAEADEEMLHRLNAVSRYRALAAKEGLDTGRVIELLKKVRRRIASRLAQGADDDLAGEDTAMLKKLATFYSSLIESLRELE